MLKTPGTLELALRFPSSLAGVPARPCTAESTFDKGADEGSAMMNGLLPRNRGDW
jgi:hypothetical protein